MRCYAESTSQRGENCDVSIFVAEVLVEAERVCVAVADHQVQFHGSALPEP
jgi:hypothetical protein